VTVKAKKTDKLEVSSDQLKAELIEIKERVGALETIASISNRPVVEAFVRSQIKTEKARQIMELCSEAQTREQLKSKLGLASTQALDHHLRPLREGDLLQQHVDDDGNLTLAWSNLFRRLPNTTLKKILTRLKSIAEPSLDGKN
jgi:hypothetical protein